MTPSRLSVVISKLCCYSWSKKRPRGGQRARREDRKESPNVRLMHLSVSNFFASTQKHTKLLARAAAEWVNRLIILLSCSQSPFYHFEERSCRHTKIFRSALSIFERLIPWSSFCPMLFSISQQKSMQSAWPRLSASSRRTPMSWPLPVQCEFQEAF